MKLYGHSNNNTCSMDLGGATIVDDLDVGRRQGAKVATVQTSAIDRSVWTFGRSHTDFGEDVRGRLSGHPGFLKLRM